MPRSTNRQTGTRVYELYDLSDKEISLVEEATRTE
jgi:hypothetical protein